MRVNIQVTVEPDDPRKPVVVRDMTLRVAKYTSFATTARRVRQNVPEMVRAAINEALGVRVAK